MSKHVHAYPISYVNKTFIPLHPIWVTQFYFGGHVKDKKYQSVLQYLKGKISDTTDAVIQDNTA